jgi:hypothetical protein
MKYFYLFLFFCVVPIIELLIQQLAVITFNFVTYPCVKYSNRTFKK